MKFQGPNDNQTGRERLEAAFTPIMSRLLRLIESRYKCEFKYRSFPYDLEKHDSQEVIYSLLSKNSSVTLDGNLLLPVRLHGQLWGYAQFSSADKLTAKQIHEIEDLVDLVLNSALITAATLEDLNRLENEIHLSEYPSNVIRLSSFRKPQAPQPSRLLDFESLIPRPRKAFSIPCLIEAQSYGDIHKMAVEIHGISGRQIFVHWDDLSSEAKQNTSLLDELTDTTIFIPDVTSLEDEQRITLIDWLSGPRTKDSPQVIAGTLTPYAELVAIDNEVQRVLLRRLSVANLKMDKDFQHYLDYGVIEFFYDSLTGRSLEDCLV
ncbi:MAG: hypothetical protein KDD43_06255 [Bdellovibrionales bacterium]|nr:hypothetical protein [Bdellovibrionales bacterium]MCB0384976.1 hypothetical protein [Bdellovibrionales bacterium]